MYIRGKYEMQIAPKNVIYFVGLKRERDEMFNEEEWFPCLIVRKFHNVLADWCRRRQDRTRQEAAVAEQQRSTRRRSRCGWARSTAWWRIIYEPRRGGTWLPGPGQSFRVVTRLLTRCASIPFVSNLSYIPKLYTPKFENNSKASQIIHSANRDKVSRTIRVRNFLGWEILALCWNEMIFVVTKRSWKLKLDLKICYRDEKMNCQRAISLDRYKI